MVWDRTRGPWPRVLGDLYHLSLGPVAGEKAAFGCLWQPKGCSFWLPKGPKKTAKNGQNGQIRPAWEGVLAGPERSQRDLSRPASQALWLAGLEELDRLARVPG